MIRGADAELEYVRRARPRRVIIEAGSELAEEQGLARACFRRLDSMLGGVEGYRWEYTVLAGGSTAARRRLWILGFCEE